MKCTVGVYGILWDSVITRWSTENESFIHSCQFISNCQTFYTSLTQQDKLTRMDRALILGWLSHLTLFRVAVKKTRIILVLHHFFYVPEMAMLKMSYNQLERRDDSQSSSVGKAVPCRDSIIWMLSIWNSDALSPVPKNPNKTEG